DCFAARLLVGVRVRREIDFEGRQLQGFEDVLAVLVCLDRNALDIDPGRGNVTMPERVLRFTEGTRSLGHHPRKGVAHLVQMNPADPRPPSITLQILDEGPGGKLRTWLPCSVVPGPQRLISPQNMQPPAAPQIIQ